ncbi:MAG: SMP-30/gluconolactonase/LRE family protein [Bacteroidales bacterium]|nr:SMP-30/gluconolactonase/LRE family protein [Bacteroidales bacterium]
MKSISLIITSLAICANCLSQNLLNNPESVVYDSLYNRYLVSNWGYGNIIEINVLRKQNYFNTELGQAAGLHIVGNVLYVASSYGSNTGIIGIDLATGVVVFDVDIVEKKLLNDITSDTSGNLYITDCDADKIFKVRISDTTYSTFVKSGLGYPNGILFDKPNNRLLVLNGELSGGPLIAVDLADTSLTTVVNTNLTAIDGLTTDQFGNFYFSSWTTDKVYRYAASFTNPPEVISSGHTNPADIFYNQLDDVLAVPNFHANIVDFIPITHTGVVEVECPPNDFRLKQNYPNPFNPNTIIEYFCRKP